VLALLPVLIYLFFVIILGLALVPILLVLLPARILLVIRLPLLTRFLVVVLLILVGHVGIRHVATAECHGSHPACVRRR